MTVDELIRELSEFPGETEVTVFCWGRADTFPIHAVTPFDTCEPSSPDNPVTLSIN